MMLESLSLALLAVLAHARDPDTGCDVSRFQVSDPPYDNYFVSDCHSSSHVIVRSPDTPRLLVAWPSGNSGIAAFFNPENGAAGSLGIHLENTTTGNILNPLSLPASGSGNMNDTVGVAGLIHFDSPALLTLPIIGSIRTIRDYTEGRNLNPDIQNAVQTLKYGKAGGSFRRTWFDGTTTASLDFDTTGSAEPVAIIEGEKWFLRFGTGTYSFMASFNYPQLEQLAPQQVLKPAAQDLIAEKPDQTKALSFLSHETKLLAGSWRFLTYFGRDTMISALLMQPILSEGEHGAMEAVISAVLERINKTDGTVCHEEVIGDYATFIHRSQGSSSTAPTCDYKMVDTDFLLPVLLKNYFVDTDAGRARKDAFFQQKASFLPENSGLTYHDLAQTTAEKVMLTTAAFASNSTIANLIHLRDGQQVGNWRDSNAGLGGGRIPYDVNTALVPAALRAIAALSHAGFFPGHPDWATTAATNAQIWEDKTLPFFRVQVPRLQAEMLLDSYRKTTNFPGPLHKELLPPFLDFHGLSIENENNKNAVHVMNTDDCFRLFLLNTTDDAQLTSFVNQTADHVLAPFPVGLSTDVGLVVANPPFGVNLGYAGDFKTSDYHGTVVWSWQLAMMAGGLGRQLGRCAEAAKPAFCADKIVLPKVRAAYSHLWDLIEKNAALVSGEMWSWKYADDRFQYVPFSAYSSTESNAQQLWSLAFLAVRREEL